MMNAIEKARAAYAAKLRTTEAERFWSKVDCGKTSDCWIWKAYRQKLGYGVVGWRGATMLAHRVALSLIDGDWESSLQVCHSCDNRACCNPAHLWRGTSIDNIRDMDLKGRRTTPRGEINGNAKLTASKISAIRASDKTCVAIGNEYGLAKTTISGIRNRRSWRHLP